MDEKEITILQTKDHISEVRKELLMVINNLADRAQNHDASKMSDIEVDTFVEFTPKLKNSTYGSEEYKGFLEQMKPALEHHYAKNSHHPEFGYKDEIWKDVVGYEGMYEISSFGRVRSVERKVARPDGNGDLKIYQRELLLQPTPKGYLRVQISRDGYRKNCMVHRLAATAFIPNPENKAEVNHRDGNKKNNNISNLEWATASENQTHAYETGLKQPCFKYFVHCVELDIVTAGTEKMWKELLARGYDKVSSASIWRSMDREGKHCGLTFVGYSVEEGSPQSMVLGMSLFDLIEMICDWRAATRRHADGDILKSIEINQKRFGYSDELKQIFYNTVKEMILSEEG